MTRDEIKKEIVKLINLNWTYYDDDTQNPTAEAILTFLETQVGIYQEDYDEPAIYAANDPNASWSLPK